jgi:RNA 3'-terminal phosphate cyclase
MNNKENSMDISQISDVKELKAMAYDQLVAKELAERNLQAINQRLAQLEEVPEPKEDKSKK